MFRDSAEVVRALGLLREGLGPYVEREVGRFATRDRIEKFISSIPLRKVRDKLRKEQIREWEVAVLLNLDASAMG